MLRQELAKEAGVLPAIHALQQSGYVAGMAAASAFRTSQDEDVRALPEEEFWARLGSFFTRRGWGTLRHVDRHQAVGLLVSSDWVEGDSARVEGDGPETEEGASCSFSTGFLSGLLTELAGGPVAVLEVSCRARGEERCSFAFGAAAAIHHIYGQLLEGAELDGALAAL
ncbi:MAG TPA: V4R domain-containing protein [Longimicrobiales bacterium]|nr:V4R domain-containing protein [Longimicrobiales bacterium]